jgi:predicted nucleic acid-binding protein
MYLLDTNIISYWMRGDKRVIGRIKKHAPADLSLSTITLAEILYGIEKSSLYRILGRTAIPSQRSRNEKIM